MKQSLRDQVLGKCRYLLNEINRDPASSLNGCFDRRYWAWKLVDMPEATFQRNLSPLSWFVEQPEATAYREQIQEAILCGLLYTARIQHADGSFDQAYPHEHSFGASAFLLADLLTAYLRIRDLCNQKERNQIERCLRKTANFLSKREELHSYISNHLAGASLGLLKAADYFDSPDYRQRGHVILTRIIENQSQEGWFPEYGGADPGYQTLCMHYLAQIQQISPGERLHEALRKSIGFIQYFIHPDGSFGGEYGSRRTEIYYPGGIALLAEAFPEAAAVHQIMLHAMENGQNTTLWDMDMGNTAPLLTSSILALDKRKGTTQLPALPFQQDSLSRQFPEAGLAIRGTGRYYCVVGASNGGVTKVFDKQKKKIILDDCGLLGSTQKGQWVTTQILNRENSFSLTDDMCHIETSLYRFDAPTPTPFLFLGLRILTLTFMRLPFFNEWIKKLMVRSLIRTGTPLPIQRHRTITFHPNAIHIEDRIRRRKSISLRRLFSGGKFSAIHMASARYFSASQIDTRSRTAVDIQTLNKNGEVSVARTIQFDGNGGNC